MNLLRYILILYFIFFKSFLVHAATNRDSLLQLAQNNKTTVDIRLNAYEYLIESYSRMHPILILELTDQALLLAQSQQKKATIASLYEKKGGAFQVIGSRDSAFFYYQKSLAIAEQLQDHAILGSSNNVIARFFRIIEPERALQYYDSALVHYQAIQDTGGIAMIYNESGVAYEYALNYQEALARYQQSLALQLIRKDSVGIGYALEFIGGVLTKTKDYKNAEHYLQEALKYRTALDDTFALASSYGFLGKLYMDMGLLRQSMEMIRKSQYCSQQIQNKYGLMYTYQQLSNLFQKMNQADSALIYLQLYYESKDSMYNQQKDQLIEDLNTRYETQKKVLKIAEQEQEINTKNNWIYTGIFVLILGGVFSYLYFKRHQYRQALTIQALKIEQQEIAAKTILATEERERQRIAHELHDGVGQMVSTAKMNLQSLLPELKQDNNLQLQVQTAVNLVEDAYCELRHIAHNMAPYTLEKNDFSAALFSLINKIDSKVLAVNLYTEGLDEQPIDKDTASVLYRIIQESVNNVMKHAGASRFDIAVIKDAEGIHITLEDNGKGFDISAHQDGAGLTNIRSRVQFLKGTLDIDTAPENGTLVAVHIPN